MPPEVDIKDVLSNSARIAELRRTALLGTAAELSFDRLVSLVRKSLRVPVSFISLVSEDRQFFKACVGMPEPWNSRRETGLSHSFCKHVVHSGTPLVISDARVDPVLSKNPAVKDIGVIAYLGVPLTTANGHVLGSLCAVDSVPRVWSGEDVETMTQIAGAVMTQIENRILHDEFIRERAEVEEAHIELDRQRKANEAALAEITQLRKIENFWKSEHRYRALFKTNRDGVAYFDLQGTCRDANPAFLKMLGYTLDEIKSLTHDDLTPARWAGYEENTIKPQIAVRGFSDEYEKEYIRKDGSVFLASVRAWNIADDEGATIGLWVSARDITERRRMEERLRQSEERLRQSQKLEAIGHLAGGIAHDFNNLLTIIGGRSELLLAQLKPDDPVRADLEVIRSAGEHAAGLTRQLLAFSRKQILQPVILDLSAVVARIEPMLRRLIREDIELSIHGSGQEVLIKADYSQIEQVLLNLVINARDAMPHGGRITIEISLANPDDATATPGVSPGAFVLLSVADTGQGMSPETQARIFEPFFTTKEPGKGTGLGLSTVYGIVKQSGGQIRVDSEIGHGSVFRIYLPLVSDEKIPATELTDALKFNAVILLVEDDPLLRKLSKDMLEVLGCTVITAENGAEALRLANNYKKTIDMVMTDVVMPGMNGLEMVSGIKRIRPHIRVLYTSGYTNQSLEIEQLKRDEHLHFIPKPFTLNSLAHKIQEVLNEK